MCPKDEMSEEDHCLTFEISRRQVRQVYTTKSLLCQVRTAERLCSKWSASLR